MQGNNCDECKPGHFYLDSNNVRGCQKCFCNGLNVNCQSSDLNYERHKSTFETENWKVSNLIDDLNSAKLIASQEGLDFVNIRDFTDPKLYLVAPSKYNRNKVF